MAPEHEIENAAAIAKAGDDPKKLRKIVRKKAPQGFVNWGEASFERLVAAEPEPLEPQLQLTAAMLINVIARGGDVFANVRSLVFDNHEPRRAQVRARAARARASSARWSPPRWSSHDVAADAAASASPSTCSRTSRSTSRCRPSRSPRSGCSIPGDAPGLPPAPATTRSMS